LKLIAKGRSTNANAQPPAPQQAQVMQQQHMHLIEFTINILESLLKSLYSQTIDLRSGCQLIFDWSGKRPACRAKIGSSHIKVPR
jgi:hypothetical protein